jgi:hypothetical protein
MTTDVDVAICDEPRGFRRRPVPALVSQPALRMTRQYVAGDALSPLTEGKPAAGNKRQRMGESHLIRSLFLP